MAAAAAASAAAASCNAAEDVMCGSIASATMLSNLAASPFAAALPISEMIASATERAAEDAVAVRRAAGGGCCIAAGGGRSGDSGSAMLLRCRPRTSLLRDERRVFCCCMPPSCAASSFRVRLRLPPPFPNPTWMWSTPLHPAGGGKHLQPPHSEQEPLPRFLCSSHATMISDEGANTKSIPGNMRALAFVRSKFRGWERHL